MMMKGFVQIVPYSNKLNSASNRNPGPCEMKSDRWYSLAIFLNRLHSKLKY